MKNWWLYKVFFKRLVVGYFKIWDFVLLILYVEFKKCLLLLKCLFVIKEMLKFNDEV